MGTRADFYVGKGLKAEWIGSIAWDGYRDGIPKAVFNAVTVRGFKSVVTKFFKSRNDVTLPAMGWPWPWNDSGTTDCSYWFFDGHCWDVQPTVNGGGYQYVRCDVPEPNWGHRGAGEDRQRARWMKGCEVVQFPNMSSRKNVALDGRSGLIFITEGAL